MVDRERVGRVNKVGYVRRDIGKKKKQQLARRVRRPELGASNTLRQLFHSCTETFKGPDTVPSPQDVQRLRHILGMMLLKIQLVRVEHETLFYLFIYFYTCSHVFGVCLIFAFVSLITLNYKQE